MRTSEDLLAEVARVERQITLLAREVAKSRLTDMKELGVYQCQGQLYPQQERIRLLAERVKTIQWVMEGTK